MSSLSAADLDRSLANTWELGELRAASAWRYRQKSAPPHLTPPPSPDMLTDTVCGPMDWQPGLEDVGADEKQMPKTLEDRHELGCWEWGNGARRL